MKRTIRWIATVLHIGVILLGVVLIVKNLSHSERILAGVGIILGACLTLVAVWSAPGRTFLGLYFERKRLEERTKIKKLEIDEE